MYSKPLPYSFMGDYLIIPSTVGLSSNVNIAKWLEEVQNTADISYVFVFGQGFF